MGFYFLSIHTFFVDYNVISHQKILISKKNNLFWLCSLDDIVV